jgi:heptosyltransferase II
VDIVQNKLGFNGATIGAVAIQEMGESFENHLTLLSGGKAVRRTDAAKVDRPVEITRKRNNAVSCYRGARVDSKDDHEQIVTHSDGLEKGFCLSIIGMEKRILIRMPNWVGDLVMATPLLTDLRTFFPEARITALCRGKVGQLLAQDRDIDELLILSAEEKIEQTAWDIGILCTNSWSSAWQFWRWRVRRRIGFKKDLRQLLLTDGLPLPENRERHHQVQTLKALLSPLGLPISSTSPRLHLLPEEIAAAKERLGSLGVTSTTKLVGINPGAAYGSAKCWLPDRFAQVTRKLLEEPRTAVVYFGDPSQVDLVKQICAGIQGQLINFAGSTTLRELAALLSCCDVVLTNDSGPMHMAAALGVPLLALFGSTNAIKTGPYGQPQNIIHKHVECSPCYLKSCPVDFRCMKRIAADEVYGRLAELLK